MLGNYSACKHAVLALGRQCFLFFLEKSFTLLSFFFFYINVYLKLPFPLGCEILLVSQNDNLVRMLFVLSQ